MNLNQKGAIDMMFVVMLAVVVIVGGFLVYRVTEADKDTSDSAVATQAGSESKQNAEGGQSGSEDGADAEKALETETIKPDEEDQTDSLQGTVAGYTFDVDSDWRIAMDSAAAGNIYNYGADEVGGSEKFPQGKYRISFDLDNASEYSNLNDFVANTEYPDGENVKVGSYDASLFKGTGEFGPFVFYYVSLGGNDFLTVNPQGFYSADRVEQFIGSFR